MKIDPNAPASPFFTYDGEGEDAKPVSNTGMTIRTQIAAMAMQGLLMGAPGSFGGDKMGSFSAYHSGACNEVIADRAVVMADALIAELNKEA